MRAVSGPTTRAVLECTAMELQELAGCLPDWPWMLDKRLDGQLAHRGEKATQAQVKEDSSMIDHPELRASASRQGSSSSWTSCVS